MYILGQLLSPESLGVEYKEFRLELAYQEVDCRQILEDPVKLDSTFQSIIFRFVDKYICKYACAFYNSRMLGNLKFGVSDIGEIIGVPIKKGSVEIIRGRLIDEIKANIKNGITGVDANTILDGMKISLSKVSLEDYVFFDYQSTDEFIREIEDNNTEYFKYRSTYISQKNKFIRLLSKYRRSINCIINDHQIREEFIIYLRSNGVYHKFSHMLKQDSTIVFTSESIKTLKYNKETIVYWITTFRDEISDYIVNYERPTRDLKMKWMDVHYRLLQDFKPLVPRLCQDGEYEMYIIDIRFNYDGFSKSVPEASYQIGTDIKSPYRTKDESGFPCCI